VPGEVHPEVVLGGALAGLVVAGFGHGGSTSVIGSGKPQSAPSCRTLANDSGARRGELRWNRWLMGRRPTDSVVG
jgi:hypothetical protein